MSLRFSSINGTPGDPDETDAHRVNAQIAMVAEEANILISALITDAEAQGLEATGPWRTSRWSNAGNSQYRGPIQSLNRRTTSSTGS